MRLKLIAFWVIFFSSLAHGQSACRTKIYNRGNVKQDFINEIVSWAKTAPDEVFSKNSVYDVYSMMAPRLGPYKNLKHRKAVMVETLLVLGMYESSGRWGAGIDVTNPSSFKNKCNEEAGAFQCSGNSVSLDPSLKVLFKKHCGNYIGKSTCEKFIVCSKLDHVYAIEHTARLMRTYPNGLKHHGPLKRKSDVYSHVRPACVSEIEGML